MGLKVKSLECHRAGRRVLGGLSFEVAKGKALLVQGPNGVGKSTLLRALGGLLPSKGAITLAGRDLRGDRDHWVESIAYAGHFDAIKPQLSVAENLRFWAGMFGAPDIAPALDAFDLTPLAAYPAQLCSAGQKRRLGLARLMLARRAVWLLDEPTVSLDAASVARFQRMLQEHLAQGGIALIASHSDLGIKAEVLTLTPPAPHQSPDNPFLAEFG